MVNLDLEISEILKRTIEEFNDGSEFQIALDKGDEAPLYGPPDGPLDSLRLVSFLIAVEQACLESFQKAITLADEKAMSEKNSPFRTIGNLHSFLKKLLQRQTS